MVNRQDWVICETVQQGISSRVHERGYYAPMEDFNLDIRRYVLERIGEAAPAWGFPRWPLGRRHLVTAGPADIVSIAPRRMRIRWKIFTLLFSFGLMAYVQQRGLAVASYQMMPALNLSQMQIGSARVGIPPRLRRPAVSGRRIGAAARRPDYVCVDRVALVRLHRNDAPGTGSVDRYFPV